jgi:hypothetical protein
MTVSATPRRAGPYAGNGVTTLFPFNFKVFTADDLEVVYTGADGVPVTLVLNSDYSVLLNPDQDANPGGSITYPLFIGPTPILPVGATLTAIGDLPYSQPTDITNTGRFLPQVFENALDRLTIQVQQLAEIAGRTLQAAVGTTVSLIFPAPSAGKFIRWRTDLLGLENAEAGTDSMVLQGLLADSTLGTRGAGMVGFSTALAYPGATVGERVAGLASTTDTAKGASYVGYKLNAADSVGRSTYSKLVEQVSVLDFGAVGDGVTNDSLAIQRALNYIAALGSGALYLPGGRTYMAVGLTWSGLSANARLDIRGDGPSSKLMLAANSGDLFTGNANGGSINVSDLEVGHLVHDASTGGYIFAFTNGFVNLRRLDVYNGYNFALFSTGCDQCGAADILVRGLKNDMITVDVSSAVPPTQQHGNITFERIRSQAYNTNTGAGFRLISGDGIFLSHVQVHGYQNGVIGQPSASRSYCANLFFDQVIIDGAGGPASAGPAVYFDGTNNPMMRIYWCNSWIGAYPGGRGLYTKNTKVFSWRNGSVIDNGLEGILFDVGCEECSVFGSVITGNGQLTPNTYSGILVFGGADGILIGDNRIGATQNGTDAVTKINTQKYGVHVDNVLTINYSVYDNDMRGNLTGTFQDGGGVGGRKVVQDN